MKRLVTLGVACALLAASLGVAKQPAAASLPAVRLSFTQHAPPTMRFEPNVGQTNRRVRFLARASGYTLFLTSTAQVLSLSSPSGSTSAVRSVPAPGVNLEGTQGTGATGPKETTHAVTLRWVGANAHPRIEGTSRLPGVVNYYIGNRPRDWHTGVPTFARVRYHNLYRGIDLIFHGHGGRTEYDWLVRSGADPSRIRLQIGGASSMRLDRHGDLVLRAGSLRLVQRVPMVYQQIGGVRQRVAGRYLLAPSGQLGMRLARYNHRRPLIIDPELWYAT